MPTAIMENCAAPGAKRMAIISRTQATKQNLIARVNVFSGFLRPALSARAPHTAMPIPLTISNTAAASADVSRAMP
ncbi:hypothetical protein D9M70_598870 [compost metagenome]